MESFGKEKGWEYISAIFNMMIEKVNSKDKPFESQVIYRGISKAHEDCDKRIKKNGKKLFKEDSSLKNKPYDFLQKIMDKENCPENIKSGLAVRLHNTKTKNNHIDYVNYIIHMINDLKTRFPKYEDENYTDLEILADVQHKGAASCLVDFSENFLTSLWFATNSDFKDYGYLICYDINSDIIGKDNLTILDPQRYDEKRIVDLLYETTKATTYSGNRKYKFWLWRPSNVNERISRQDSIFIFGLEKFSINEHDIITIPIHKDWKEPIQQTLKKYFGVTGESIYCDIDGYADSNSKLSPYKKTVAEIFRYEITDIEEIGSDAFSALQNGISCFLQCEYDLALKYFSLFEKTENILENKLRKDYDYVILMEFYYSKANCLKHTDKLFGAINEYNKIIDFFNKSIQKTDDSVGIKYYTYLENKYLKSINDLIDIYYDTKQYSKIKKLLTEISNINGGNENYKSLEITTNNEIVCLMALDKFIKNESNDTNEIILNDFTKLKYSQPLYYVLNLYFCFILETLNIKAETKKVDYVLNNKADLYLRPFIFDKCKVLNYFKNPKVYSYWNLKDIKKTIIRVQDRDKYLLLKEYTSKMEDFVEYCKGAAEISPW